MLNPQRSILSSSTEAITVHLHLLRRGCPDSMPHGEIEPSLIGPTTVLPDVSRVKIKPYGTWFALTEDEIRRPFELRAKILEKEGNEWLVRRLREVLTSEGHGVIVNPARAPLARAQGLLSPLGTYIVAPPSANPSRSNGGPRSTVFIMTGYITSAPFLKGGGFYVDGASDHRVSLWPLEGELQRSMAYIGAVSQQNDIAFGFTNGQVTFITKQKNSRRTSAYRERGSANGSATANQAQDVHTPLPLLAPRHGPMEPYHADDDEDKDAKRHTTNMDYPVALRFESEVPVFDASNRDFSFAEGASGWGRLHELPEYRKDIPYATLVTIGFTAFVTDPKYASSPWKVTTPLQFVVVHGTFV
ncbi:hypothetical protein DFP72DRAFT_1076052 [Ephemerocybe angulata]|uniref:Uncharacterized protein n=1 Tax=Ephemerocybe angulata TaxID=980116 RepID=A0A8H6HGN9_9AGAR|nr:hypothetical protein DFP72DRAFT_1076052 [Tulosesus angulatus]